MTTMTATTTPGPAATPPMPDKPPADKPPADKKAPAKKAAAPKVDKPPTPSRGPGRPSSDDKLAEAITDTITTLGMALVVIDPYDAQVVVTRAPTIAAALVDLGKQNPKVRRKLESLTEASAWGGVLFALAGTLVPIAAHHGWLPGGDQLGGMFGAPSSPGTPSEPAATYMPGAGLT